jgi:hypothetical protein
LNEVVAALDAALLAAPASHTLTDTARKANETLGLDWSDAKWRGLWKSYPAEKFLVQKKLGSAARTHVHAQKYYLAGDMRGATVGDPHAPYQDDDAVALAAKVLKWWKPDVLVHNGDNTDFAGISRFDTNPARRFSIQDEVDTWQAKVYLPLKSAVGSKCKTFVLPGNHDLRLLKLMWRQPELFSVRSLHLPALLEAEKLGFEYVGYALVVDNLLEISHGDKAGLHPARAELAKRGFSISTLTAHVHKADRYEFVPPYGPRVVGQSIPALCQLLPEYMVDPNWSNGLALWEIRNHVLWLHAIVFTPDYTCMVGDKHFAL